MREGMRPKYVAKCSSKNKAWISGSWNVWELSLANTKQKAKEGHDFSRGYIWLDFVIIVHLHLSHMANHTYGDVLHRVQAQGGGGKGKAVT